MMRAPRYRTAIAALALTAFGVEARAQSTPAALAERIERITSRPEFAHALWGIEFYSLDTRQPLYSRNADKLFTPGSTTKLLTEGTALALLGADYRFRTRVFRTGPVGRDGVLNGDLVLVASGDPNLSARVRPDSTLAFENEDHSYGGDPHTRAVPGDPLLVVRALAHRIAARGIRRVSGRVIVDASLFPEGARELGTDVVISPIVVNDNVIDVTVTPARTAGTPPTLDVSPATAYVRFVNRATTGATMSPASIHWVADSVGPDSTRVVTVGGSVPARGPAILYSYPVPSPTRFAEVVLAEALREEGVRADPRDIATAPNLARLRPSYTDAKVVAEHISPSLREEVKVTLKVSQNLHASMMPALLGALLGKGDTTRSGFDLEREFLSGAGLDLNGAQQADGAGGDAHYTPAFMVSYLAYMATRPDSATFRAALPILGRDGTLFDIQPASPAAGHVVAKTGTYVVDDPLNRRLLVTGKGLAGYMTTADGRHLAFAIYVNNVAVAPDRDVVTRVVGQALGEIAAAAYTP
jgi:PBP4 family serine-type D-alanyl-D-alanine carboxypeptidase